MSEVSEPLFRAEDTKYFSISLSLHPPPVAGEDVIGTRATPRCFPETAVLETEALDASPVPEGILLVNAASLCRFVNSTILLGPTFSRARARIKEMSSKWAGGHKHVFLVQRTLGATPEVFIPATALVGWLLAHVAQKDAEATSLVLAALLTAILGTATDVCVWPARAEYALLCRHH